jgi:DnaJ-class molecular chaperone
MDDVRIMPCETCNGSGWEDFRGTTWVVRRRCQDCRGWGELEVKVEPITMEDADKVQGEGWGR